MLLLAVVSDGKLQKKNKKNRLIWHSQI